MVDADRGITNTILLYFSGHGSESGKSLILHNSILKYARLYELIREELLKSKNERAIIKVQLVIDACYSGAAIDMFNPAKNNNQMTE